MAEMNHEHMITPFASADEMVAHHVTMYGSIGQIAAEAVLRWASLWPGLNPLDFLIVFAPDELGPYNRYVRYTVTRRRPDAPWYIVGNRHIGCLRDDGFIDHQFMIDFIVHEMAHHRQADILLRDGIHPNRGSHRDRGWYKAVEEAALAYLGVEFPTERWPRQKARDGRLTEVELTRWPHTFRELIAQHDPRLERGSQVNREEIVQALSHRAGRRW
jgi:hypothetical protein